MRRILFLVVASASPALAAAQVVPGRDLLSYPVATAGEAPVLATDAGDGLWNAASVRLPGRARWRAGAAAVETPADQGLGVQSAWITVALPAALSVGAAVTRANVRDLVATDLDPTPRGHIAYGTTMASLVAAAPLSRYVTGGLAVRYRSGSLADARRSAIGVDGGLLAGGGWWRDLRVGASTLLWRPGGSPDEASYSAGAHLRAIGVDSMAELRIGYAATVYDGEGSEHYAFAGVQSGPFLARGGIAAMHEYGRSARRARLGLGLRVATYYVAVARETSAMTTAGTYLFTITTTAP